MRLSSFRLVLVPLLALAAATSACDDLLGNDSPADAPSVQLTADLVAPGTEVELRLTNRSATSWGYNVCLSARLQVRQGADWVDGPEPLVACTLELTTIRGGRTAIERYFVPVGLADGTYRLRFRFIRDEGAEAFVLSNVFEVSSAPTIR